MPSKKHLQPIYDLTSQTLDLPPHVIKAVISHQFQFLRSWIREPYRYAHVQIPQLGRFEYRYSSVNVKLRKIIQLLRENPTEELREEFRFWWQFRHIAYHYLKSRKLNTND